MLRLSITLACLLLLVPGTRGEIDFTPTVSNYVSSGAEHSSVNFKDGKRSITMNVPRKWTCRGDAARLRFLPPDENFAEGIVQAAAPMRPPAFDEATVKALEARVLSTVPQGSQGLTVVSRMENSIILNQDLSYEFVVSYQVLGQVFQRSVIFVNSREAQLVFQFTAPKTSFENLNNAFRRAVSSWYVTEPAMAATAPMTASK